MCPIDLEQPNRALRVAALAADKPKGQRSIEAEKIRPELRMDQRVGERRCLGFCCQTILKAYEQSWCAECLSDWRSDE